MKSLRISLAKNEIHCQGREHHRKGYGTFEMENKEGILDSAFRTGRISPSRSRECPLLQRLWSGLLVCPTKEKGVLKIYHISHENRFPCHLPLLELAVSPLGWPLMSVPTHHSLLHRGRGGSEDKWTVSSSG